MHENFHPRAMKGFHLDKVWLIILSLEQWVPHYDCKIFNQNRLQTPWIIIKVEAKPLSRDPSHNIESKESFSINFSSLNKRNQMIWHKRNRILAAHILMLRSNIVFLQVYQNVADFFRVKLNIPCVPQTLREWDWWIDWWHKKCWARELCHIFAIDDRVERKASRWAAITSVWLLDKLWHWPPKTMWLGSDWLWPSPTAKHRLYDASNGKEANT